MSSEFIQFQFPCTDCIVRAACKEKPKDERLKHLLIRQNTIPCLALPRIFPELKPYQKGLVECWANIGVDILCRMHKTEDPKTSTEINNNIPMQYLILMGQMSYILQWIINSTSWEEGSLKQFDRDEINRKLKVLHL